MYPGFTAERTAAGARTCRVWRPCHWPLLLCLAACGEADVAEGTRLPDASARGDPERGGALIRLHGCGSCHAIPGIPSATGRVGPPLDQLAQRGYLAGIVPNTYQGLVRWILDPRGIDPATAMPDVGLSTEEAEAVAAYLYRP